ncbi:hypothetical protein FQA39_LY05186 [Lamprigera yunnana]|nr:hypothetical protein FQA39_LY05186 [Lamprigera yunnana]
MGITVVIICTIAYIHIYFQRCYRYWKDKNVPQENPKLVFGNFLDMLFKNRNLGKYFGKLYEKFNAPYFGIYVLNTPFLVIKDPDIIKYILIKEFKQFSDKITFNDENIDPIGGNLLMHLSSTKWRFFRPHLSQAFSSGKLKRMFEVFKNCARNMDTYLKVKSNVNFKDVIGNYNIDSVSSCLFGIHSNSFIKPNPLKFHSENFFPKDLFSMYSYFFIHNFVKLFKNTFGNSSSTNFLVGMLENLFKQRKDSPIRRCDVIDLLLDLKVKAEKDNKFDISEKTYLAQAVTFFVASQETSIMITSYTLHELSINTNIQERLRSEINKSFREFGEFSYSSIYNMKFLDMVVSETLRKYPILNFLNRKSIKDHILPSTGLKIDRGTNIIIPIHGLHFDPNYYPNPEKYDPDRFNDINEHPINSVVYLPFGVGPRSCIGKYTSNYYVRNKYLGFSGKRFALLNIKLAIASLVHKFKIVSTPTAKTNLVFNRGLVLQSSNSDDIDYASDLDSPDDTVTCHLDRIKLDSFVLVRFPTKKTIRYVGCVTDILKETEFNITFLRGHGQNFTYPDVPNTGPVLSEDIVLNLSQPVEVKETARSANVFRFPIDFSLYVS